MLKLVVSDSVNDFKKWVCSWDEDTVIGNAGRSKLCPIASYMKFIYSANYVWVMGSYAEVEIDNTHCEGHLPEWAKRFIYVLDGSLPAGSEVTAKVAKYVLEKSRRVSNYG